MIKIPGDKAVFFDVDDTLIKWGSGDGVAGWSPIPDSQGLWKYDKHVQQLKEHAARGQTVIVWSAGGVEWANKAIDLLGLASYVTAVLCKPTWSFDDLPPEKFMPESRFIKPDNTESTDK